MSSDPINEIAGDFAFLSIAYLLMRNVSTVKNFSVIRKLNVGDLAGI